MVPKLKIVTGPATLAVSLTEVKTFLRIDGSSEDTILTTLIKAATLRLEALTDRKFVTQTLDIFYDSFPMSMKNDWWDGTKEMAMSELQSCSDHIKLPIGPMQSVTGLYTYDDSDVEYMMSASSYYADTQSPMGGIYLRQGGVWPTTVLRPSNGVRIRGVFGFGTGYVDANNPSQVPNDIQEAIKILVSNMYEHRGDELPKIPASAALLVEPYRRYKV